MERNTLIILAVVAVLIIGVIVVAVVIGGVALIGSYYWVGGLATKQPTPDVPIVIDAQKVSCSTSGSDDSITVLIQNLDPSDAVEESLYITDDNGNDMTTTEDVHVPAGSQGSYTFEAATGEATLTPGATYVIYGMGAIGTTQVTC